MSVDTRGLPAPPARRRYATFQDCSIEPRVLAMGLNDTLVLHAATDAQAPGQADAEADQDRDDLGASVEERGAGHLGKRHADAVDDAGWQIQPKSKA